MLVRFVAWLEIDSSKLSVSLKGDKRYKTSDGKAIPVVKVPLAQRSYHRRRVRQSSMQVQKLREE